MQNRMTSQAGASWFCESCVMSVPGMAIQPVAADNSGLAVQFLIEWVSDGEAGACEHPASHAGADGASLVAIYDHRVIGIQIRRDCAFYDGSSDNQTTAAWSQ